MPKKSNTITIYAAKCNIDGVKKEHLTRDLEDAKSYLDKWNIIPSMIEMEKCYPGCQRTGCIDNILHYDGSTPFVQIKQEGPAIGYDYIISFKIQRYKVK